MTPKVQDQGHRAADKELAKLIKRLQRSYRQASLNLQEKINAYMERFEKEDAAMRALYDSGELSHEDYMSWRCRKIAGTKQWRDMLDQLTTDLVKADKTAARMIRDELPEVYAENHNYGTYQIERDLQMSTSYMLYNKDAVKRLLQENPDLLPQPSVNVRKDERWNRQHIQSAVLQGILTGESMQKIAGRMQDVAEMDARAAMRNARTAVTGAENAGKLDSMRRAQGLGVQLKKLWLATRDSRTRDSHAMLDGEMVEINEPFSNGCMYPGDPDGVPAEVYNCRCAMRSKVAGADPYSPDLSRNERLGGMSYDEWKQQSRERIETKEFKDQISRLKQKTSLSYEDIIKAGELTLAELEKEKAKLSSELDRKIQETRDTRDEFYNSAYSENPNSKSNQNAWQKLSKKLFSLVDSREEINARALTKTLAKVRPMGIKDKKAFSQHFANPKSSAITHLRRAYNCFPTDWVNLSVNVGQLTAVRVKRGRYDHDKSRISISGKDRGELFKTSIHELSHRFEKIIPGLLQEESIFYNLRAAGEPLEKLVDLTGNTEYGDNERARKDRFVDPYMGKDYNGVYYELATMGFQYLYTNPSALDSDPDMKKWLFGLLTLL